MRNESIFIAVVLLGALALGVSGCKVYRWTGHRDAWTPPTPAEVVPPPVDVYERADAPPVRCGHKRYGTPRGGVDVCWGECTPAFRAMMGCDR